MAGLGGIQTSVNEIPAPGVEGAFCSLNPRFNVIAGPGGLVAGVGGVVIGRFAWMYPPPDANGGATIVTNSGTGIPAGFAANEQQALNTVYLSDAGLTIPVGFPVTLYNVAEVWAKNTGAGQAVPGMKAYANFSNGAITFAAAGAPTAGGTSTASTIAATTSSVTGSITGALLTVTAVGSGTVYPGTTISGTNVVTGTKIVSQVSGTAGGIGVYLVSIPEQTVAATTISGTYGLLTVGGTVVAPFAVNSVLAATGSVVAGTTITALGTGTGAAGTYVVDNNTVVGSQAINVLAVNVETRWFARSGGLTGELVKISTTPLG